MSERVSARTPALIDVFVGGRLRHRRMLLAMTQDDLSARVDLSLQQLHKYEAGVNRMSVGRLSALAAALGMQPQDFFHGAEVLAQMDDRGELPASVDDPMLREICDLVIAYADTASLETRRRILARARALASGGKLEEHFPALFRVRDEVFVVV